MRTETGQSRPLREEERAVIAAMLKGRHEIGVAFTELLDRVQVKDMQDGGMGSIRFDGSDSRRFGKTLAEARYMDNDGTLVSITLNADEQGKLFELDFWKVDFSPLRRYPQPFDLDIIGG